MTREGFIKGLVASVGLAALPAPVAAEPAGRVSDAEAKANYAAYLASIPTEVQPLDAAAALGTAHTLMQESGEPWSWQGSAEAYAMALWDHTQAHQSREYEYALADLPRGHAFALDHMVNGLMFEALQFGARIGMGLVLVSLTDGKPGNDDERAAWLARVYEYAEGVA